MTRTADVLEKTMAQGVLFNDSRLFAGLATHLHNRGVLKDDPESVALLRIALQTISNLDRVNQEFRAQGKSAPVMFEDSRKAVETALEALKTYPAQSSEKDVEQVAPPNGP